jgi:large subunit ribosomal protein L19
LLKIAVYDKVKPMEITKKQFTSVSQDDRKNLDFKAGDTVRVWNKILEKGKTRLQAFEGLVLSRKHGKESGATFTIRKVASGVGVERIFPLYSPNIDKIEVLRKSKTRRSKLYYIRTKAVKEVKKRLKSITLSAKKQPKEVDVDVEEIKSEE